MTASKSRKKEEAPAPPPKAPPAGLPVVELPIGELLPNPRNPRVHPDSQVEMLAASLARFGQRRPVLARSANRMLIAGHGVHLAALRGRLATLKVILWDCSQAEADAFMLADNQLTVGARDDSDRARELLREIPASDYLAVGFDLEDAEKLLSITEAELEVTRIETDPVRDRFWLSVRGPLTHQAEALAHLRKLMTTLPGVEVELGTLEE